MSYVAWGCDVELHADWYKNYYEILTFRARSEATGTNRRQVLLGGAWS